LIRALRKLKKGESYEECTKKKKPIKDFFFKIKLKLWELISIEIEIKFKR
jgi:hypothetical protein